MDGSLGVRDGRVQPFDLQQLVEGGYDIYVQGIVEYLDQFGSSCRFHLNMVYNPVDRRFVAAQEFNGLSCEEPH